MSLRVRGAFFPRQDNIKSEMSFRSIPHTPTPGWKSSTQTVFFFHLCVGTQKFPEDIGGLSETRVLSHPRVNLWYPTTHPVYICV